MQQWNQNSFGPETYPSTLLSKRGQKRGATERCNFLFMQGNEMELQENNYLYKGPVATKRATSNVLHSPKPLNKTGRHDSQSWLGHLKTLKLM